MSQVQIKFSNCYGIGELDHIFDFTHSSTYSVYAPNGFMKTSLSKTFSDYAKGDPSQDLIHTERPNTRHIKDMSGVDVDPKSILVIEPYNQDYVSEKASLLLVNQALKTDYEEALKKIELRKTTLEKVLKQASGLTGSTTTPESEILKCFGSTSLYKLLESLQSEINSFSDERLSQLSYASIFNDKTLAFLDSGAIENELINYINTYKALVENSPILSKSFNHYHAKTIHKNLSETGFFQSRHSINLFNGVSKEEIVTADLLDARIEHEKNIVLTNEQLTQNFNDIDKKLSTKELREFRDYLFDNKDIVAELVDYNKFQKNIWLAYLANAKDLVNEFVNEFQVSKEIILRTSSAARSEKTQWEAVVKIFTARFDPPFQLVIANQEEVILKGIVPKIEFSFSDGAAGKSIDRSTLLKVLSQGEKRALYILNIIFELFGRKHEGNPTLIIADDIADSFDYKNKYAIVEYLKDINNLPNFRCIFLTHNFDFHRTVSSRLKIPREKTLFAVKNLRTFTLKTELYQNDPFEFWKANFNNLRYVISAIPFVRNLSSYCNKPNDFDDLTSLLHIKNDTHQITFLMLENIYKSTLNNPAIALPSHDRMVIEVIYELADLIVLEPDQSAELESKIILSIAIRTKTEEFIVREIADQLFVNSINTFQTIKLIARYILDFPQNRTEIELLERVNLMTPENIHLNSFMYEPILDMDPSELKKLYSAISLL